MRAYRRLFLVFLLVISLLGVLVGTTAADPEVCGYVTYRINGGTPQDAPGLSRCAQAGCPGGVYNGPDHVGVAHDPIEDTDVWYFVCVRGV